MLHEAKRPAEVLLDKVDGTYDVIYQSATLKSQSTAKVQLPTGTCGVDKRNSINVISHGSNPVQVMSKVCENTKIINKSTNFV